MKVALVLRTDANTGMTTDISAFYVSNEFDLGQCMTDFEDAGGNPADYEAKVLHMLQKKAMRADHVEHEVEAS